MQIKQKSISSLVHKRSFILEEVATTQLAQIEMGSEENEVGKNVF